jgi:hypothetical protein
VDLIRDEHRNSRVGHMFELLLGAAYAVEGQLVEPAVTNNPNYDFDISISGGARLRLSFKNFGTTPREDEFRKRCLEVESLLLEGAAGRFNWLGLYVVCDHYPGDSEWGVLRQRLPQLLPRQSGPFKMDGWNINPIPSPVPVAKLEPSRTSCNIVFQASNHLNERNNFLEKIQRECSKFNKACKEYEVGISPGVLFRISETAPFDSYVAWGREYLAREDVRINNLWFYQSAVAQTRNDATALHHHMNASHSALPGMPLSASFIVGVCSPTPARDLLIVGERQISLAGKHWHQRYELFDLQQHASFEGASVNINVRPGFTRHGVMQVPGGGSIILSPCHQAYDHVALFT